MIDSLMPFTFVNPQLSKSKSREVQSSNNAVQQYAHAIPEAVRQYVSAALADNTRRAYQSDLRSFHGWGGVIPCTAETLAAYIADQAASLSPVTITRRVTAISRAHTSQGLADPAKTDLVRTVLRGVRRSHGKPQRQVSPILRQDLIALVEHGHGIKAIRDRALLLLGFAAALRRSELVALDVHDIAFVKEGLIVHVKRSKTDQEAQGRKIGVPWGRTAACPVKAVLAWLDHAQITDGPMFTSVKKGGAIGSDRLSAHAVAEIVKAHARAIGLDPQTVSGHSLRAGLATSAAQAGIAVHKIQQQTGHRSTAMLSRYIRDADLFTNNAGGIL